jgi:hypothetical protein
VINKDEILQTTTRTLQVATAVLLGVYFLTSVAKAHEFYDPWCCNETDCAPYHGEVVTRPDGYWIPEFQTLVPYDKARITPWHDENQYHLCEFPKGSGTVRCFYAKPGGV